MPSREDLHDLVKTLPEGALEAAYRSLKHFQTWPPAPPPELAKFRELGDLRPEERLEQMRETFSSAVTHSSMHAGDKQQKGRRGVWSAGDLLREGHETHYFLDEHEFTILERLIPTERRLIYNHKIIGPNGQFDAREVVFTL